MTCRRDAHFGPEFEYSIIEPEKLLVRIDTGAWVQSPSNDYLFSHVLPPLRKSLDIDRICIMLKEDGILVDEQTGISWKGLKDPKGGEKDNEEYSRSLTEIFNKLVEAADSLLKEYEEKECHRCRKTRKLDKMLAGSVSSLLPLLSSQNTDAQTTSDRRKKEEIPLCEPSSSLLSTLTPLPTSSHASLRTSSGVGADPCTCSHHQSNSQSDYQTQPIVQTPLRESTVVFRAEGSGEFYPSKFRPDGALYLRDPTETLEIDGKEKVLLYNTAVSFVFGSINHRDEVRCAAFY